MKRSTQTIIPILLLPITTPLLIPPNGTKIPEHKYDPKTLCNSIPLKKTT